MAQLHELRPEAKLVHITRDLGEVCLSMPDWHCARVGEVRWAFTADLRAGDRPLPRSW
jgi:hypothetical protein